MVKTKKIIVLHLTFKLVKIMVTCAIRIEKRFHRLFSWEIVLSSDFVSVVTFQGHIHIYEL